MKYLTLVLVLICAALPSYAAERFLDIRQVTSPSGIKAWLVQDNSQPVIALQFAFLDSGSALESEKTQGLAQLLSNTMDEGAGDLDSTTFQKMLQDRAITLRFTSGRDSFGGTLKTLTRNKETAFDLLHLALNAPRFDQEPVTRMINANLGRIRSSLTDPGWAAARLSNDRAFEGHPYALNSGGTLSTLPRLTPADLRDFYTRNLTRDRLIIGVAGDITAQDLAPLLDRLFGELPETGPEDSVPSLRLRNTGTTALYKMPIPQTVIEMLLPAFGRDDPDYYALQVLNYIFGGAGFGSRLMEEVREKRGLSYGIYSSVRNYRKTDALAVSLSTNNDSARQALDIIRTEMDRLINEPVSERELDDAKSYLTGSMPLSLSSTDAIAGILLSLQRDRLPVDYLDGYAERINAVNSADIQRVAARLFSGFPASIAMVGDPAHIDADIITDRLPNAQ